MGHRDYVYKWLFYALISLFFILVQCFGLVHLRVWVACIMNALVVQRKALPAQPNPVYWLKPSAINVMVQNPGWA